MQAPEPRILFLSHGAERTGPPIWLATFLGWMATHAPRAQVVVAREGPLTDSFRRHADVVVASHHTEPAEPAAAALRRAGHPELARITSDRWLRHRLRHVSTHDLVYVNSVSGTTASLLANLPTPHDGPSPVVVTHVHELEIGLRHNILPDQLAALIHQTDHFLAVSQAVADNLVDRHGVDPATVHVHRGFIDLATATPAAGSGARVRRRLGIPADAFVLGSVGLPDWRKAPDLFLRVGWTLRQLRPDLDLHLVWVGGDPDAPDRWQLDHEAAHLGLRDRVHLVPDRPGVTDHLDAFDAFALTAREDAFPLAVLEAAAAAVPIATFDAGGTPELVRDDAGTIAPYPDTDRLAEVVAGWADDPDGRRKLGATAQQRVREHHGVDVAAPALWADLVSWLAR